MILTKVNLEKKITSNKKGFTLVEIVAALAIFSILFVGVTQLIANANKGEINTNTNMENTSVSQGIRDILFKEDNEFFNKFLKDKTIILEGKDLDSLQEMLIEDISDNKIKPINDNTYISENDKENPIKYKIYISSKEIDKGLYSVVLTSITLKNTQYYYYVNGQVEGNRKGLTIEPTNKSIYSLSEEMIIRPINLEEKGESTK